MTPPRDVELPLPRNYLRPCLLLLLAEGTSHGYELLEQVRVLGMATTDAAGVYRCLRAMDEEGLVQSQWEPSTTGPARRVYSLTAHGSDRLQAATEQLAECVNAVTYFLGRYSAVADGKVAQQ